MKKIIFITIVFILFNLLTPCVEAINLVVEEGKVRLNIPPGQTQTGIVNIKNTSSEPIDIRAYLEDWYYLPGADGSKEFKPAGTTALSCASWINFIPAEFTIPAYGKQAVNYTVKVPAGATGGHYAVLFFETMIVTPDIEQGIGVGVAARMGSLFYIEPAGTIIRQMRIKNLSLTKEITDNYLAISADVENSGNVDITLSGTFHIIDKEGVVYARGEFNEVYTFPGDRAKIVSTWKEPITYGKYDLVITLDLGKALKESGLGRGLVIAKEAEIDIGFDGEVLRVGKLR